MSTKVLLNKVGAFTHSFLDIYIRYPNEIYYNFIRIWLILINTSLKKVHHVTIAHYFLKMAKFIDNFPDNNLSNYFMVHLLTHNYPVHVY